MSARICTCINQCFLSQGGRITHPHRSQRSRLLCLTVSRFLISSFINMRVEFFPVRTHRQTVVSSEKHLDSRDERTPVCHTTYVIFQGVLLLLGQGVLIAYFLPVSRARNETGWPRLACSKPGRPSKQKWLHFPRPLTML